MPKWEKSTSKKKGNRSVQIIKHDEDSYRIGFYSDGWFTQILLSRWAVESLISILPKAKKLPITERILEREGVWVRINAPVKDTSGSDSDKKLEEDK